MRAIRTALLLVPMLVGLPAGADGGAAEASLDGKSFQGSIRATGWLGLFGHDGTLSFSAGMLAWSAGRGEQEYSPAPYQVRRVDGRVVFSARTPGKTGDYVDWTGTYDGTALGDVQARWTRVEGDFFHDLLLPDVVTLVFTPDKP